MRHGRWLFVVVVALGLNLPATAAGLGIFGRKTKTDAAEQVPALVMQLKTDKDESKRAAAAEELRNYDPKAFPEIMTVLTDAILKDQSAAVRAESASTIARLRPINQQAGFALEQASANDPSLRVRMAAKQALWQYHLVGYRSGRPPEQPQPTGPQLPTVAAAKSGQPHVVAKNPHTGTMETAEPPLADAPPPPAAPPAAGPTLPPVAAPKLVPPPPPIPLPPTNGPSLPPPGN